MGAGTSVVYNVTEVNLNEYKCSDRGLVMPFISEYTWPIWVRAILYFVFLLYLFLGIAKIADIFMTAIEQITSVKRKVRYLNANGEECFLEKQLWNNTVANLTLMALGSSCPEILLAIIEIVGNNFKAGELGPGTIVGSAAYNLLMITGLCVCAIQSPKILRIENYKVFIVTTFFSVFAYIWLFLVLAVITPDRVDLWEAILTLAFFAILIVLAYMAEKNFYFDKCMNKYDVAANNEDAEAPSNQDSIDSLELKKFIKRMDKYDLPLNEKQKLIKRYLLPNQPSTALSARIRSARVLSGSKRGVDSMRPELINIFDQIMIDIDAVDGIKPVNTNPNKLDLISYVEFASSVMQVDYKDSQVTVTIRRHGNLKNDFHLKVHTKDCTAVAGADYTSIDYADVTFENEEQAKEITVDLNTSKSSGESKVFFLNYGIPENFTNMVKRGSNQSCMISVSDNSGHGEIQFASEKMMVNESNGTAEIKIIRLGGASGQVGVTVETYNLTATDRVDYVGLKNHKIQFEHGEKEKVVHITILDDKNKEDVEEFGIRLLDVQGAKLGQNRNMIVEIHDDDEVNTRFREALEKIHINPDYLVALKQSWADQFRQAANVNEGDVEGATAFNYFMHCLSFPWKMLFAFVPPPGIWGGWLCFTVSIVVIGLMTALVGDAAAIFGCLVNLKDSITAISFVAMGTSLPDTFASAISAKNDKTADNAIGNVTGSNSVNVFLGLGLPWVLAAIYWQVKGLPFVVPAGDLAFSIIIYTICCSLCILLLVLRRYLSIFGKGELGGPLLTKWATTIFFTFLWIAYIGLSAMKAYNIF